MARRNRRAEEAGDRTARLYDGWAYHASASANRESICRHGLDITHMGAARGISGSQRPEVEGVYLARSLSEALRFAQFGVHESIDVWSLDARGLVVLQSPDGFLYYAGSIGPDRVRLVEADLTAAAAARRQTDTSGS